MIEELKITEIDSLTEIANNFFASSDFLNDFDMKVFKKNWSFFIENDVGVIFISKDKDNKPTGAIGGCMYPDPNNGELLATEFFWFVNPECRGSGIKLLKVFEKWAKEKGCKKVIMVHLSDSMPEKVSNIYIRFGYRKAETHYIKEVA